MKNSLFKRALAAAATVPLALTQCVTIVSNAATAPETATAVEEMTMSSSITLDSLLYIKGDKTVSSWNSDLALALEKVVGAGNAEGTIDTAKLVDLASGYAGGFAELIEACADQIGTCKYVIEDTKDITLTVPVGDLTKGLTKDAGFDVAADSAAIADKYDLASLNNIDYSGVSFGGGFVKVVIGASALDDGTTVPVTISYTDGEGNSYGVKAAAEYVLSKINEIKAVTADAVKAAADGNEELEAAINAEFDKTFDQYVRKVNKALNGIKKAAAFSRNEKTYSSVAVMIADANKLIKKFGFNKQIPASASAIMNTAAAAKAVDYAKNFVSTAAAPFTLDIEAAELGAFADSVTDITASVKGGTASAKGYFADAEADEVKAYYETIPGVEYVSSIKEISVKGDYSDLKNSDESTELSLDVQIIRIVETKEVETTTSESTTTESTTSESTTSESTTSESTTSESTTSESTTSETTTSETTTTYVVTTAFGYNYVEIESDYGFYLDVDTAFNKDQIKTANLHSVYKEGYVDDEGNAVVTAETEGPVIDIKDMIDFTATPASTYNKTNTTFKYDIQLCYTGEDIVDEFGNTIIKSKDELDTTIGKATIVAYIGVKGDADLDNKVTASDASTVLAYYANLSSGDPSTVQLSTSNAIVSGPDSVYDDFAAFLCDVDTLISESAAWGVGKVGRTILASDASSILTYYAMVQEFGPGVETWNKVLVG